MKELYGLNTEGIRENWRVAGPTFGEGEVPSLEVDDRRTERADTFGSFCRTGWGPNREPQPEDLSSSLEA